MEDSNTISFLDTFLLTFFFWLFFQCKLRINIKIIFNFMMNTQITENCTCEKRPSTIKSDSIYMLRLFELTVEGWFWALWSCKSFRRILDENLRNQKYYSHNLPIFKSARLAQSICLLTWQARLLVLPFNGCLQIYNLRKKNICYFEADLFLSWYRSHKCLW